MTVFMKKKTSTPHPNFPTPPPGNKRPLPKNEQVILEVHTVLVIRIYLLFKAGHALLVTTIMHNLEPPHTLLLH